MATNAFIFCKQCGSKNPRDAQNCEQCGAVLHTPPAALTPSDAATTLPGLSGAPSSTAPDARETSPLVLDAGTSPQATTPTAMLPPTPHDPPAPAGTPSAGVIFCSRCGAKNPRGSQYCDQCSAPLQGGPPAAAPIPTATMPGFSRAAVAAPAGPPLPGVAIPPAPAGHVEDAVGRATAAASAASLPLPTKAIGPSPVSAAPPAATDPAASSEALPAVIGAPPLAAGKVAVAPTPPAAKPAKRNGLPLPLIAGAIITLLIFVGIGFFALNGVSNNDPQNDVRTAVAQQATVQAQQGDQIRVALTQLADSGGSLNAQRTALAQATVAAAEAQATTTAIIAQVAAIAVDKKTAGEAKGVPQVVVPAAFAPAPMRAFITPVPPGTATTFTGAAGTNADSAPLVPVPVTITNKLVTEGDSQFYRVDLTKYTGGSLSLTFTAPRAAKGQMELHLMDEPGVNDIKTSYVNPAATDTIVETVKPGRYTIKIDYSFDPQNPYKLVIAFNANGFSADKDHAVKLGLVGSVQGFLNSSGDVQWYVVDMSQFPQGGAFTAALSVPASAKGAMILSVLDPGGGTSLRDEYIDPGRNNLIVQEDNVVHNYYIVVRSYGGFSANEPYVLATYFQPHSAAGMSSTAVKITPPTLAKVRIGSPKDAVYLQFEIKGQSNAVFNVHTPPDGNEIKVSVTDANGQSDYGAIYMGPGQQKEGTALLQNPGIYLVRVGGYNGNGLSLKPVQVDLRIDPVK